MKYAVIDWDNTIRNNYTLFFWMDFLFDQKVISRKSIAQKMDSLHMEYNSGSITHDDYAKYACEVYTKAMIGISKEYYDSLIRQFIEIDEENIFSLSKSIFQFLQENHISPIIISGAPQSILEQYAEKFHIYKIFAFSEQFINGICNGKVEYNYGLNKRETIEQLIKCYGEKPYLGFGDSSSDIPIFELSEYAFCIANKDSAYGKFGSKPVYVHSSITEKNMFSLIENTVH